MNLLNEAAPRKESGGMGDFFGTSRSSVRYNPPRATGEDSALNISNQSSPAVGSAIHSWICKARGGTRDSDWFGRLGVGTFNVHSLSPVGIRPIERSGNWSPNLTRSLN